MDWMERIMEDPFIRYELARALDLYSEYRDMETAMSDRIEDLDLKIREEECPGPKHHPHYDQLKQMAEERNELQETAKCYGDCVLYELTGELKEADLDSIHECESNVRDTLQAIRKRWGLRGGRDHD